MTGLLTLRAVARYLGKRDQDVARLIELDGLPAVRLPAAKRIARRIPLHGLHRWLSERCEGSGFITVEELAREIAGCAGADGAGDGRSEMGDNLNQKEAA